MKSHPWCDISGVWLLSSAELQGILDRSDPYQTTVRSQRQWNFAPDSSHTSSGSVRRDRSCAQISFSTLASSCLAPQLQRFPVDFSFLCWNPSAATSLVSMTDLLLTLIWTSLSQWSDSMQEAPATSQSKREKKVNKKGIICFPEGKL